MGKTINYRMSLEKLVKANERAKYPEDKIKILNRIVELSNSFTNLGKGNLFKVTNKLNKSMFLVGLDKGDVMEILELQYPNEVIIKIEQIPTKTFI